MNKSPSPANELFQELDARAILYAGKTDLSLVEIENVWSVAAQTYFTGIEQGRHRSKLRQAISAWLWQHFGGRLAKSPSAIYRNFLRKMERMSEAGNVADLRKITARERAPALSADDRLKLVACAVNDCAGRLDFAWQRCVKAKSLSQEILERYRVPENRRPRCPKAIRKQVASEVKELYQYHIRPHFTLNNVAAMRRDWSEVFSQDVYESDDKTLDVRCLDKLPDGTMREIRPQFLPMIDQKSGFVLGFVLIPQNNYNAVSIRTLIRNVCHEHGLPNKHFFFERGMWKEAKLLGNNHDNKPFAEVENFATRCGIAIRHAASGRARSKLVETAIRLMDRQMVSLPGYTTRDEKLTERRPGTQLLTFDELFSEVENAVDEYNNTKSESRVKGGYFTPKEVWESCRRMTDASEIEPIVKLPPQFEYLLSAHCETTKLRGDGVRFTRSGEYYHFHSRELVAYATGLAGEFVKVWFDPGDGNTAVVTDISERTFIPCARIMTVPAVAETETDFYRLEAGMMPHRAKQRQLRERYCVIRGLKNIPVRTIIADSDGRAKADHYNQASRKAGNIVARNAKQRQRPESASAARELAAFLAAGNQEDNL